MNRLDVFSRLNSYCHERYLELGERQLHRPMLKSYVIETSRSAPSMPMRSLEGLGETNLVDDDLYSIKDSKGPVGYLEKWERFVVFYTLLKSSDIDPLVARILRESPDLDNMWIADPFFRQVFNVVNNLVREHRFVRIGMEVNPHFDIEEVDAGYEDEVEENFTNRVLWSNRLGTVASRLDKLSDFPEFRNISMLRFPATGVAGGHEFYFDGKVTNRSVDFLDHRNAVLTVLRWYKDITDNIEESTWLKTESSKIDDVGGSVRVRGGTVTLTFNPSLEEEVLERFVDVTFRRRQGPFKLWGNPILKGNHYYHIHALDLHLLQRIFLELSPRRFVLILPEGTCGNTVHRLLANIQRYLSPNVLAVVADKEYSALAAKVVTMHGPV